MGVILQGILGGFSGKVGPVVGGKWKDIDYMRSYVVPANPNTGSQQTVRAKFSALVALARGILTTILQPYWDPFYSNQSGFNAFISNSYALTNAAGVPNATLQVTKGTLTGQDIDTITPVNDIATVTWVENTLGNALPTDSIYCIAYDPTDKRWYFAAAPVLRSAETISVPIEDGSGASGYFFYLFAFRGTGSELVVSDSTGAGH